MSKLFQASCDTSLDSCESSEELFYRLLGQLSKTQENSEILNAVFTHLHGLEPTQEIGRHSVLIIRICVDLELQLSSKDELDEYMPEESDWILNGRIKWLKRISKGLESLSDELNIPPVATRSSEKQREINRKWMDISTVDHKLKGIRPIYAASDLYDACKV